MAEPTPPLATTPTEELLLVVATAVYLPDDPSAMIGTRPGLYGNWVGTDDERRAFFTRLRDEGVVAPAEERGGNEWRVTQDGLARARDEWGARWRAFRNAHPEIEPVARNPAEYRAARHLGRAFGIETPLSINEEGTDPGEGSSRRFATTPQEYPLLRPALADWADQGLLEHLDFGQGNGAWVVTPAGAMAFRAAHHILTKLDGERTFAREMGMPEPDLPTGPPRPSTGPLPLIDADITSASPEREWEVVTAVNDVRVARRMLSLENAFTPEDIDARLLAQQLAALLDASSAAPGVPAEPVETALALLRALRNGPESSATTPRADEVAKIAFDLWREDLLPFNAYVSDEPALVIQRSCRERGIDLCGWERDPRRLLVNASF